MCSQVYVGAFLLLRPNLADQSVTALWVNCRSQWQVFVESVAFAELKNAITPIMLAWLSKKAPFCRSRKVADFNVYELIFYEGPQGIGVGRPT